MDREYIPPKIKEAAESYNNFHPSWVAMKIFNTATCAAALLSLPLVDKDHRDNVIGLSAIAGLSALGIHRREKNKKHAIQTALRQYQNDSTMNWDEKCDFFDAQKAKEQKEKNGLKIMGAGIACYLAGQPVLGSTLVVAGLLHNTTSQDFLKIQDRILDNHDYRMHRQKSGR